MAIPQSRSVRIDFRGNDLDPPQISQLLGVTPTRAAKMGEAVEFLGEHSLAKTGLWELRRAVGDDPIDLAEAIRSLFAELTSDMTAWAEVTRRFGGGLMFSIPSPNPVDGAGLSRDIVRAIAERGLSSSVAIYQERPQRTF
jgi:hypothetical protein